MNNYLVNIRCFSFNKKDVELLLFIYNISFYALTFLIGNDFKSCFLVAFLVSLVALFVVTAIDIFEKVYEDESKLQEMEGDLGEKIRSEYLKIHKLKRRKELLLSTDDLNPDVKKNIISNLDIPHNIATNKISEVKKIDFHYLDSGDSGVSEEQPGSHPQGI